MKKILFLIFSGLLLLGGCGRGLVVEKGEPDDKKGDNMVEITTQLEITSPAFDDGGEIPSKYTCDGEDINPLLKIIGVPAGTEELVLIMDDPDAPNGDWVHWLVWNIDPKTSEIAENSVPDGAMQGKTSFGGPGYGGPCPPSGEHRYFFKLYALAKKLDLGPDADKAEVLEKMEGSVIEETRLMGTYTRN